jgi:DNA-directed RNA polymerase specialized sigma24 family protein
MDQPIDPESVTTWIGQTKDGDAAATEKLWARYFESLADYARRKLPPHLRQMVDEEDIALSAFNVLLQGFEKGGFEQVRQRDDLWKVLTLIAARKAQNHVKYETRQKRGKGRKRGDSAMINEPADQRAAKAEKLQDPAWLAEFADICRTVFDSLPNDSFRLIASLRLAGHSVKEIAEQMVVSTRTIERKLNIIRSVWLDQSDQDSS